MNVREEMRETLAHVNGWALAVILSAPEGVHMQLAVGPEPYQRNWGKRA